jgi:PKD repeat protein
MFWSRSFFIRFRKEYVKMKRILLSAGAILLLATLQFGETLENAKKLITVTGKIRWSQCAFDVTGVLWVTCEEDTNGPGHPIWVVSYDGTTVSEPLLLTANLDVRGERPGIGTGIKGTVAVVWGQKDPISTVMLRVRDPKTQTWLPAEIVSEGNGYEEANVAIDKDDNIHIGWFNMSGGSCYVTSRINGEWTGITALARGGAKDSRVAVGPDGKAWATFREKGAGGKYKNWYSTRTVTTDWTRPEAVEEGGNSSSHPMVTVGPDNVAVMAYGNIGETEGPQEMRIKKLAENSPREIVWPKRAAHYPRLVIDKDLNYHLVSAIGGGDHGSGLQYANKIGEVWSAQQIIGASQNKVVGLATDPFGNVAACQSTFTSTGADVFCYSIKPIKPAPLPDAQFTFSPTTGYPPLPVSFTATKVLGPDGNEVEYEWSFGDGGSGSGRNTSHTYLTAGTYDVTLKITDYLGRSDSEKKSIIVLKTNPLVPVNLSATITLSQFRTNPEITYNLFWAANPDNIPEHIEAYAIYMKEDSGDYIRLLTLSTSTFSVSFKFTDLTKKRTFAISSLGYGGTESPWGYF